MAFPSYAGSITQLAGNAQAQELAALQQELTRELESRRVQERGIDRGLEQQNRLRDDTLRRDEFGLRKQEAEAAKKYREDRLALDRDFMNSAKTEKTKTESDKLFYDLFNGINGGTIRDEPTLQGLEGGKLSSDQWITLRGALDNARAKRGIDFISGAQARADELNTQFQTTPEAGRKLLIAKPDDPFKQRYTSVFGLSPDLDPAFTPERGTNAVTSGTRWFGMDTTPEQRQKELDAMAAAAHAADVARTNKFRSFYGDSRKKTPELVRGVIPNTGTLSFQPSAPAEMYGDGSYATAPDARSFFQLDAIPSTNAFPPTVGIMRMPGQSDFVQPMPARPLPPGVAVTNAVQTMPARPIPSGVVITDAAQTMHAQADPRVGLVRRLMASGMTLEQAVATAKNPPGNPVDPQPAGSVEVNWQPAAPAPVMMMPATPTTNRAPVLQGAPRRIGFINRTNAGPGPQWSQYVDSDPIAYPVNKSGQRIEPRLVLPPDYAQPNVDRVNAMPDGISKRRFEMAMMRDPLYRRDFNTGLWSVAYDGEAQLQY